MESDSLLSYWHVYTSTLILLSLTRAHSWDYFWLQCFSAGLIATFVLGLPLYWLFELLMHKFEVETFKELVNALCGRRSGTVGALGSKIRHARARTRTRTPPGTLTQSYRI